MRRCVIVLRLVLASKSFVKVEKFIRKEVLLQFKVPARRKELLQLECVVLIGIVAIFIARGKLLLSAMVLVDGNVLANSRKFLFRLQRKGAPQSHGAHEEGGASHRLREGAPWSLGAR